MPRLPFALAPALVIAGACFVDTGSDDAASASGSAASTGGDPSGAASTVASAASSSSTGDTSTSATATTTTSTSTSTSNSTATATETETDATTGEAAPLLCGLPPGAWTLTPPQHLADLGSNTQESDPWFMPGDLRLLFSSRRSGAGDLYLSQRSAIDQPWGPPTLADALGVNSQYGEIHAILTDNELALALVTDRPGGLGGADIWYGLRDAADAPFGALVHDPTINSSKHEFDVQVSGDGLRLYFNVQENALSEIVMVSRESVVSEWSTPAPVAGIESPGTLEGSPFLFADERLILFSSDRLGSGDVWWAIRDDRSLPFEAPTRAPVINDDAAFDGEAALSADGCELLFASNRLSGTSDWEIYASRVVAP